jgi:DNA circularisation protein N-terminus
MSRTNCAIGKDYVPASFKGVGFNCLEVNIEGGRRGAEGEFPFGEITAYADLGRKIQVYHLTAVFREDDHVFDSHALFEACQSPGPGPLVHPTRGTVIAACRSIKVKDNIEEAGETTAEMEFVEANGVGVGGPSAGPGYSSLYGIISRPLNLVSRASFLANYRPALVAQPWRNDIIHTAQSLIAATHVVAQQTLTKDALTSEWRAILAMEEVAKDEALATQAANVEAAIFTGMTTISTKVQEANVRYKLFRRLVNISSFTSGFPTGLARESEEAVLSRHRTLGAIGMAEAAMGRKYAHLGEGLAVMDDVLKVFDDEARVAYDNCDNGLFLELRAYAVEFAAMMHDLVYRLPARVIVDFAGGVHPLVAAYAIYKDSKRHRELELMNIVDANGRFGPHVTGLTPPWQQHAKPWALRFEQQG